MKENQRLWDFYETVGRDVFQQAIPRLNHLFRLVRRFKRSGRILEVGFGNAYLLKRLCCAHYQCYGIDISSQNVQYTKRLLRKKNMDIFLRKGNITKLPFSENFFDAVIASEVLEHLDSDNLKKALQEVYRCLKRGGLFISTVPAKEDLKENLCYCPKCGNVFHRWGHKQSFSWEKMTSLFQKVFPRVSLSHTVFGIPQPDVWSRVFHLMRRIKCGLGFKTAYSNFVGIAWKE
jgi:ubiquinone/menaquinone biosynthesis C-methylase UbiE